ncbi:ferredoxin--NADP reductase [Chitinivorax sp. PXF-14]|uniref:ferredoxin--NADP reductase n=1 Tax=Chitinivorax sp. PXF-14 TaxID=3230488 RepID=UPI0034653A6A
MSQNEKYTRQTIIAKQTWAPSLFTFRITRDPGFRFIPGQFARLGVKKGEQIVWRAYSMTSADYDDFLEFYSIVVPDGEFTPELARLGVGDDIYLDRQAFGYLTTDRFELGRDLWMLSTGTGLAPFLSILQDPAVWQHYERLVLVHGARHESELAYEAEIAAFAEHPMVGEFTHKLRYLRAVTRDEPKPGTLKGRITELLTSGELERVAGVAVDKAHSHVMICGNPNMVADLRQLLQERYGLNVPRRGQPGNLVTENGF